jgi:hypothetical protein
VGYDCCWPRDSLGFFLLSGGAVLALLRMMQRYLRHDHIDQMINCVPYELFSQPIHDNLSLIGTTFCLKENIVA